ncbi:MAG: hypothetical protein GY769_17600 [bacterium]|nr:hypothetical protein [bacterium]
MSKRLNAWRISPPARADESGTSGPPEPEWNWERCPGCGDEMRSAPCAPLTFLIEDEETEADSWCLRGWKCDGWVFGTVYMVDERPVEPDHDYVYMASCEGRKVTVIS